MPVDIPRLSTICIPFQDGSTTGKRSLLHGVHTPYDYNEVLND